MGSKRVVNNIPPERKGSTKKKTGSKYLLVGVPKNRVYYDHPRMAALDLRIEKAAMILEEKFKPIFEQFLPFLQFLQHFTTYDI